MLEKSLQPCEPKFWRTRGDRALALLACRIRRLLRPVSVRAG